MSVVMELGQQVMQSRSANKAWYDWNGFDIFDTLRGPLIPPIQHCHGGEIYKYISNPPPLDKDEFETAYVTRSVRRLSAGYIDISPLRGYDTNVAIVIRHLNSWNIVGFASGSKDEDVLRDLEVWVSPKLRRKQIASEMVIALLACSGTKTFTADAVTDEGEGFLKYLMTPFEGTPAPETTPENEYECGYCKGRTDVWTREFGDDDRYCMCTGDDVLLRRYHGAPQYQAWLAESEWQYMP